MAKFQVVCVRDRAAGGFNLPFCQPHIGVAIRAFGDEVARSGSPINGHPSDYSLWHIGEFDDSDGTFTAVIHRLLASASDFVTTG